MNETKPTANAATTVVSTPSLTGRSPPARRRAAGRRRGRGRVRAARARPRCAPPAAREQRDATGRERDEHARDDPGGEVEALGLGLGQHGGPVRVHERGLDLRLVQALGDLLADERALLVGDRRRRDVERGPHSTHMTSSSTSGSVVLRLGGAGEPEDQHEREQDPHARLLEQPRQVLVEPLLRDRAALERGDLAVAVDQERLRVAGDAELAPVLAVAVAQAGERDLLLARGTRAPSRAAPACRSRGRCRPARRSSRGCAGAAASRTGTGRTTTPTRSGRRPCPSRRPAIRCRRSRAWAGPRWAPRPACPAPATRPATCPARPTRRRTSAARRGPRRQA